MRTFKTILSNDYKNFFYKRNIISFAAIGLLLLLFMHLDMINYKSIIESKKAFQGNQQEKTNLYVYYDQYGGHGIQLKYIPSPMSIINSDSILNESLSGVNIGEKLNIHKPLKYRDLFLENSDYIGLSGIAFIFASLFGLIGGYELTTRPDYLRFLSRIKSSPRIFFVLVFSKIIFLIFTFFLLIGICSLWLSINGINLFNNFTLVFVFMVALMISFFCGAAAFFGTIIKDKSTKVFVLAVFFIASILITPLIATKVNRIIANDAESLDTFEHENLKLFMEIERRLFKKYGKFKYDDNIDQETIEKIIDDVLDNEFKEIMNREADKRKQILKKIKVNQTLLAIFPTTFYSLTNKELSSCGALGFIDFHLFSQSTKNKFRMFIIKKKFYDRAKPGKVEPFTKKGENKNVFFAKSHLPFNFWLGVLLTLFYTVVLFFLSYRIQKKRMKVPEPKKAYQIEKKKDNPLFVLCENEEIKTDIFNYYQNQKASVCLEKINTGDFMFNGVKPHELFSHLCRANGVQEKKAGDNLVLMGIRDLAGLPFNEEIIFKIYAAVITASDFDLIVIDDFVKKESREFENDFFRLLLSLEKSGKKILYLSTQMQQTSVPFAEKIKVKGFKEFPLDFTDTSLR